MIRILIDSTADYTNEEVDEKKLMYIPMHISWDGNEYVDGVTIQRDEFYKKLEETESFPKTSQPSPQNFVNIFEEIKEAGDTLICILLSSKLSGTYSSACLAKQIVDYENIYVVDSLTATAGIQLLVRETENKIQEGWNGQEIFEHLEQFKKKVCIFASVDTLEYLKRGGRISKTVAAIGEIAKVKPLIEVNEEGEIGAISKSIGFKKVTAQIVNMLDKRDLSYPLYTVYTNGQKNLKKLESKIEEKGQIVDKKIQIGPTIGTHIGSEAFGIVFIRK